MDSSHLHTSRSRHYLDSSISFQFLSSTTSLIHLLRHSSSVYQELQPRTTNNTSRAPFSHYCMCRTDFAADDLTSTANCTGTEIPFTLFPPFVPHSASSCSPSPTAQSSPEKPLHAKGWQLVLLTPGLGHLQDRYQFPVFICSNIVLQLFCSALHTLKPSCD